MVLVFIGAKMLAARWVHVNAAISLGVVAGLLGGSIAFSLLKTRRLESEVSAGLGAPPPDRAARGEAPGER
jgi:predicted tellurium resistance membrane protein TerC